MVSFVIAAALFLFPIKSGEVAAQPDYCRIYGLIYETKDLREAQFKVYEEGSDAFANILVFEQQSRLYADKPGHWTFTESKHLADYVVYFVSERRKSDFSVYFTDYESFAGCNR